MTDGSQRRPRRRWWADSGGIAVWATTAGVYAGIAYWWPIAIAVGAGYLALVVLEKARSESTMTHLHHRFPDLARLDAHSPTQDRLFGMLDDLPVLISNTLEEIRVLVQFPARCTALVLERARA
ncbi:MAG: hypothetical protein H0X17_20330, partial [Deltaproteobacteria bacterium]|nr:hypothetical protein [Deltaproteobacteria bacterium]